MFKEIDSLRYVTIALQAATLAFMFYLSNTLSHVKSRLSDVAPKDVLEVVNDLRKELDRGLREEQMWKEWKNDIDRRMDVIRKEIQ